MRYQKTGELKPKARMGSKGKTNPEELKNYVKTNPDKILLEIASKFGVSTCAVYKRLKQLGFSYKKAYTYTEADEEKNTKK